MVEFPISGVETYWWLPAAVAFLISALTSTGGVTGAFVILPFQVSVLGYTSPGSSATNLVYNIIAVPVGALRFIRDRKMHWGLALVTGLGTIPGLVVGAWLRMTWLTDPRSFKFFAGWVLLALAIKLIVDLYPKKSLSQASDPKGYHIDSQTFSFGRMRYRFGGEEHSVPTVPLTLVSLLVGVIGGAYGIGGAAVLSPFLVAVYRLPVHSIAGAMLVSTWLTSVAGVIVYFALGAILNPESGSAAPDWLLGLSFGIGGTLGIYAGALLQRFVPPTVIKLVLAASILLIGGRYIWAFFG